MPTFLTVKTSATFVGLSNQNGCINKFKKEESDRVLPFFVTSWFIAFSRHPSFARWRPVSTERDTRLYQPKHPCSPSGRRVSTKRIENPYNSASLTVPSSFFSSFICLVLIIILTLHRYSTLYCYTANPLGVQPAGKIQTGYILMVILIASWKMLVFSGRKGVVARLQG